MKSGDQREKTVNIRSPAGGTERTAAVRPGETPRQVLSRVVGGKADDMLLRVEEDGYLQEGDDVHAMVRDGEQVYAGKNPVVG